MRLGVTRPAEQLIAIQQQAAARGLEVISLPIIQIHPLAFAWPTDLPLDELDWVIFSSSNAARLFLARLELLDITLSDHTQFAAIGDRTAETLERMGRRVDFIPSVRHGRELFTEFIEAHQTSDLSVLFARAKEVAFDPRELLEENKIRYHSVVCYETEQRQLEPSMAGQFLEEDFILFTAPSAVRAFHTQFGKPVARPIAIGRTTAAEMNQAGWPPFITMANADIEHVWEYL